MARPSKYATAKEAAENALYSKFGGQKPGLLLEEFIGYTTRNCSVCGAKPKHRLTVSRKNDSYTLYHNHLVRGRVVCGTCKKLAIHFDMNRIVKHCARIMAKRMHDKRRESK